MIILKQATESNPVCEGQIYSGTTTTASDLESGLSGTPAEQVILEGEEGIFDKM